MPRTMVRKRRVTRDANARWLVGTMAVAVSLVVVLIVVNLFASAQPALAPSVSSGRLSGSASAPVSIEIFSDFQCPYCARADGVLHQVAAKYFDTGKASVTFRYYAFIGAESEWAAQAAECAGEQGKFWQYGRYLFTHQAAENQRAFARSNLTQFAAAVGLEANAFNTCFDSGRYAATVKQDSDEGARRGVRSTPTFFVNGRRYAGYIPADQFGAPIDSLQPR